MPPNEEPLFYNAVALTLEGDYGRIAKLKEQHSDWASAYASLGATMTSVLDPTSAWEILVNQGVNLTLPEDAGYPELLKEIAQPPFGIYSKGGLTQKPFIPFAIIGTRRATPEGKATARRFAGDLAKADFAIVSGLAFGIDCAAHEGALTVGGVTIAVLANGLDSIYPSTNTELASKILANHGMIISEYPIGSPALPYRFLERNRIVSGLSKGILVVESPAKSGSLATARFALEQNRDVFVVPGSITNPNFFGSHELIRQGAGLVTKPEEILEAYDVDQTMTMTADHDGDTVEEKLVLQALRESLVALDVDKIISLTRLEPHVANQTITFLLLRNPIKESENGYTI